MVRPDTPDDAVLKRRRPVASASPLRPAGFQGRSRGPTSPTTTTPPRHEPPATATARRVLRPPPPILCRRCATAAVARQRENGDAVLPSVPRKAAGREIGGRVTGSPPMRRALLVVAPLLLLAACGSDDSGSMATTAPTTAVGTVGLSVSSTTPTVTATAAVSTPTVTAAAAVSTPTVTAAAAVSTPTVTAAAAVSTPTVTATVAVSTPTVNTGTFTETFTGTDGNDLANGWSDDSGFGGSDPIPKYQTNRGSTLNNTTTHVALKAHGLTLSGDWQMDFDCFASRIRSSDGYVGVAMVSSATFQGWGVLITDVVHIQRFNVGGGHDNVTNVPRPGSSNHQSDHVTMTRRGSDGFMEVFLNGVSTATFTDNALGRREHRLPPTPRGRVAHVRSVDRQPRHRRRCHRRLVNPLTTPATDPICARVRVSTMSAPCRQWRNHPRAAFARPLALIEGAFEPNGDAERLQPPLAERRRRRPTRGRVGLGAGRRAARARSPRGLGPLVPRKTPAQRP